VVHSEHSLFQQRFQKKLYHVNSHELGFLTSGCGVKNDVIGLPEWQSDKKSDSDS